MEIKHDLPIRYVGKNLVVQRSWALTHVIGSSSAQGNLHMYGIKKKGSDFIVPIKFVRERIEILEQRLEDICAKICVMRKILEEK